MVLARLLAPVWLKLRASPAAKSMVVLFGRPVISPTTAAVCAELVPWTLPAVPGPGVVTRKNIRSPTLRPPGARMLVGKPAVITGAAPTVAWVVLGNVNEKLVSGKL